MEYNLGVTIIPDTPSNSNLAQGNIKLWLQSKKTYCMIQSPINLKLNQNSKKLVKPVLNLNSSILG